MGTVNLVQLAKALGLSKSTVSKALKDSHETSAATKERVKAMAKELNYQPNPYASSLRKHKSKTIAVVMPQVDNNFLATAIKGIQMVAHQREYHVLLYLTYDDPEREKTIFNVLKSGRVDGIIISTVCTDDDMEHIKEITDLGVSVVFFDRICESFPTTKVTANDVESAFQAVEHLIQQGCKRIAYMYVLQNFSIGKRRLEGYVKALEKHNIPIDESLILRCDQDYEGNYQLLKSLLNGSNRPDGILSPVEKMAITAYYVCDELQLNIPNDVKIISFTCLSFASLLSPSLTTVVPPAYEMGEKVATLLMNSLEKKKYKLYNEEIHLPATIIERNSTRLL
ncbi:MAG TPA: LacI family transcriptional regulator [Chitinophagaceae bacterium]|nr:LacI family transcriptional regulator [Chitinophagaceae bacterium]